MADPRRGPQATPKRPFENLRANARQGAMNEEETGAGFGSRSERIKRARFDAQGSISGVAGPSRTSNQLAIVADPSSSALLDSLNSATFDPHQQSLPMSLLPSTIPPSIEHHSPVLQAQDAPENFSYSPEPLLETRVLAHSPRLMSEPVYISSDDDDGSILPLPSLPALRRRTIALPNILEAPPSLVPAPVTVLSADSHRNPLLAESAPPTPHGGLRNFRSIRTMSSRILRQESAAGVERSYSSATQADLSWPSVRHLTSPSLRRSLSTDSTSTQQTALNQGGPLYERVSRIQANPEARNDILTRMIPIQTMSAQLSRIFQQLDRLGTSLQSLQASYNPVDAPEPARLDSSFGLPSATEQNYGSPVTDNDSFRHLSRLLSRRRAAQAEYDAALLNLNRVQRELADFHASRITLRPSSTILIPVPRRSEPWFSRSNSAETVEASIGMPPTQLVIPRDSRPDSLVDETYLPQTHVLVDQSLNIRGSSRSSSQLERPAVAATSAQAGHVNTYPVSISPSWSSDPFLSDGSLQPFFPDPLDPTSVTEFPSSWRTPMPQLDVELPAESPSVHQTPEIPMDSMSDSDNVQRLRTRLTHLEAQAELFDERLLSTQRDISRHPSSEVARQASGNVSRGRNAGLERFWANMANRRHEVHAVEPFIQHDRSLAEDEVALRLERIHALRLHRQTQAEALRNGATARLAASRSVESFNSDSRSETFSAVPIDFPRNIGQSTTRYRHSQEFSSPTQISSSSARLDEYRWPWVVNSRVVHEEPPTRRITDNTLASPPFRRQIRRENRVPVQIAPWSDLLQVNDSPRQTPLTSSDQTEISPRLSSRRDGTRIPRAGGLTDIRTRESPRVRVPGMAGLSDYQDLMTMANALTHARPRGTPAAVIAGLQSGPHLNFISADSDPNCPICLEAYTPTDLILKLADCPHWLHKHCLESWLHNANTCPICRTIVQSSTSNASLRGISDIMPQLLTRPHQRSPISVREPVSRAVNPLSWPRAGRSVEDTSSGGLTRRSRNSSASTSRNTEEANMDISIMDSLLRASGAEENSYLDVIRAQARNAQLPALPP